MWQFQIPNTHLVDHRYIAVRCASCFHHTCQMNACDIYQHILLTLALLTYNTTFNWSPACASGILICRRFVPHSPTVYTMGKCTNMIKSSNATIPDPQHTSRGLSIYRSSVCLISPTHMPNKHIMCYLLDTQHILLTLDFFTYNAIFDWSLARVSRIPICRGFVHHPPTAYTMGKALTS